jgi:hypothetical protein
MKQAIWSIEMDETIPAMLMPLTGAIRPAGLLVQAGTVDRSRDPRDALHPTFSNTNR